MLQARRFFAGFLVSALLAACSSTTVTGSWRNADFSGQIRKVYIVGIAKEEINRRIFEDEFSGRLQGFGVTGISSYQDLSDPQNASKETIAAQVRSHGADSILMTRLISKRTEEAVNPGYIRGYGVRPGYGYSNPYDPYPYYRNWGSYYDRCCFEMTYEPATITQYQVATIEANLYDAASGELIWAGQLETVIDANTQRLIVEFVDTVIEELRKQGVI